MLLVWTLNSQHIYIIFIKSARKYPHGMPATTKYVPILSYDDNGRKRGNGTHSLLFAIASFSRSLARSQYRCLILSLHVMYVYIYGSQQHKNKH